MEMWDRPAMRPVAIVLLCAGLSLAALGCGSSGSGASGSASSSASSKRSPGGLKVITAPKFTAPGNGPVKRGLVEVAYRNITIDPHTLRVRTGTTLRWSNSDAVDHNVTSVSGPQRFASGNFGQGHSYSVKLTRPGTIHYECTIHPVSMNGTIEVLR
jgi:plastocyanin